jgi:hypothetical protein
MKARFCFSALAVAVGLAGTVSAEPQARVGGVIMEAVRLERIVQEGGTGDGTSAGKVKANRWVPPSEPHCQGVRDRAQLGEPLSDEDQVLLRSCSS